MSKLKNVRHEKFCQSIAMGMSQKDSYIKAGYKARDNSAEVESARLIRNDKVANRINEIRGKTAEKFEITKDKLLSELAKTAIGEVEDKIRHSDKLKATEIINKMCGWNEPEKVDLTGKSIEKIGDAIQKIAKSK